VFCYRQSGDFLEKKPQNRQLGGKAAVQETFMPYMADLAERKRAKHQKQRPRKGQEFVTDLAIMSATPIPD